MPHAPTGDARARVASQWNDLFVRGGTAKETRTRLFCCLCLLLMPWLCIGCVFSGRIETDFTSSSFRKPGVEFQGAREADRGPEDRDGPFERSAGLDWLHSRRGYRVGVQEGLPVYIDDLAEICDVISGSGGIRGLQIMLGPADHIRASRPRSQLSPGRNNICESGREFWF
jgi:hypothetical protein